MNKNNIEHHYLKLVKDILDNGVEKQDRTGTGTISVFGRQIRHDMKSGFPLLTTKKMYWKGIVTELLWFLRGDTNIKYLLDNDCHIWDGDTYKYYLNKVKNLTISDFEAKGNGVITIKGCNLKSVDLYGTLSGTISNSEFRPFTKEEFINKIKTDDEFAEEWGGLGPLYGKQWRSWERNATREEKIIEPNVYVKEIDQITEVINKLKTNPDDRGIIVSAWNVGKLDEMVLRPCHNFFQFYTRELTFKERCDYAINKGWMTSEGALDFPETHYALNSTKTPKRTVSLMFNMRSNDVPLGLPFNIASYALLLEIIGRMVNMIPDELIVNIGDGHIYKNQIEGVKEQLTRQPLSLPKLKISDDVNFNGTIDDFINSCDKNSFSLDGYQNHPSIKIPLSN